MLARRSSRPSIGSVHHFSPTELLAIQKLREALKHSDVLPEIKLNCDWLLFRTLKAHKMDTYKAEENICKYAEYIKKYQVPGVYSEVYPADFSKTIKAYIGGSDYAGRPLVIIPDGGRWNCRRQIELGREEMLGRYLHRLTEASEMELIKRGVDATILISNVEGMPFSHFCSKKMLELTYELASYYATLSPGSIKRVYLVNVPALFRAFMKTVISLLPICNVDIFCFGTDREKWESALLECIPESSLPPEFGGTNTDFQVI